MSVHNSVGCMPILKFGSPEQQERFLKPMARGEMLGAFCLTEPQAGSDAAAIKTRAERDGNHYVLNGVKQFITSGKNGDVAIVFAVTDPQAGKRGISAFIVPTGTPGYRVASVERKLGQKASDTCQIVFEDLRLTPDLLLGAEGEGYKVALANLEGGRIGIAAQSVGIAQACLEESTKYAKQRQQFNRPLADFQAIQWKLADMSTQIEASRLLTLSAAWLRDRDENCGQQAAQAKLFASRTANFCADEGLQIHGGAGYTDEFPIERLFRDARITEIYEGATDIQRIVIARKVLAG
jgi:alkylation response protein AidB-like acyl-CoA dehydrogenase